MKASFSKRFAAEVLGFHCYSCADGTLRVRPIYRLDPVEAGLSPVPLMARLALAAQVQRVLNAALGVQVDEEEAAQGELLGGAE